MPPNCSHITQTRRIKAYEDYFEDIAKRYTPIGHDPENNKVRFATFSREQVMAKQRNNMNMAEFCLILLDFDPYVQANGSRMYRFYTTGSFEVLKKMGRSNINKTQIMDEALDICREIVAYMIDQYQKNTFPLGKLDDTRFEFYPVDQVYDDAVGFGVQFDYHDGFGRGDLIKPANWTP